MMTAEQLKSSILQLAMQGKLVPQNSNDEPASVLLKKISEEKNRLIKEGKIKKQKPLPEIKEEEIPFDIPESWEWVHLKDISNSELGKTLNKAKDLGDDKPYLCSINIYWDGIHLDTIKKAKFDNVDILKYQLKKGDVLICEGGDAGRTAIWNYDTEMYFQNALHRLRFFGDISSLFFKYLMELYKQDGTIDNYCKGMTIKHLVQGSLNSMLFPLPPLSEQKRIVAKIEELMAFVEQYAAASTKLNTLNTSFPDLIKKSILQEAIQGKLVPQDPNDEPASVLLKKISEEKNRLIKEGKIKKEKPLAPIKEEDIPFDIPDSWKWVRWCNLSQSIQYGFNAPAEQTGRIRMVRISDIQNGQVIWQSVPFCSIPESEIEGYLLKQNDILFARTGGTVGKSFLVKTVPFESIYAGYLIRTRYSNNLSPEYLKFFMETSLYWSQLHEGTIATAQPNCNGKTLSKMVLPLPPYEEQKRIVAKIEELMAVIDNLSN